MSPDSFSQFLEPSYVQDHTRPASSAQERARLQREFPEFSWLGESFNQISEARLTIARGLSRQGFELRGPEVLRALGVDPSDLAKAAKLEDIKRRSKRAPGQLPAGKSLDARTAHVAVKILCAYLGRLHAPRRGPSEAPTSAAGAALLLQAGLVDLGERDAIEAHPRANRRKLRAPAPQSAKRLGRELRSLERGDAREADETDKPLPVDLGCGATRRNHRRRQDARARYEEERVYKRKAALERTAAAAGNAMRNPDGVKPLPLHEGRKARAIAFNRVDALRFLMSVPPALRWALFQAATKHGARGRFCVEALWVYAFYAYVLFMSATPRPCMRRAGFDRAAEGLCREALAVAFVWNPYTRAPVHANTISALVATLEEVGLVTRESPNSDKNAYTGTTGWALNVYRVRNAEQLTELLEALGIPALPEDFAEVDGIAADASPS